MRDVCVTKKVPEYSVAEIEQAQLALSVGLDRARKLVHEAKLEMGWPARAQAKPPGFHLAQVE
jgi:hypothetical protein